MRSIVFTVSAIAVLALATPARAELVFFSSGRTLSVKSHRLEGETIVMMLRSGGEIVCDLSVVARIAPDEVPYPEPDDRTVRLKLDSTSGSSGARLQPDIGVSGGVRLQAEAPYSAIID